MASISFLKKTLFLSALICSFTLAGCGGGGGGSGVSGAPLTGGNLNTPTQQAGGKTAGIGTGTGDTRENPAKTAAGATPIATPISGSVTQSSETDASGNTAITVSVENLTLNAGNYDFDVLLKDSAAAPATVINAYADSYARYISGAAGLTGFNRGGHYLVDALDGNEYYFADLYFAAAEETTMMSIIVTPGGGTCGVGDKITAGNSCIINGVDGDGNPVGVEFYVNNAGQLCYQAPGGGGSALCGASGATIGDGVVLNGVEFDEIDIDATSTAGEFEIQIGSGTRTPAVTRTEETTNITDWLAGGTWIYDPDVTNVSSTIQIGAFADAKNLFPAADLAPLTGEATYQGEFYSVYTYSESDTGYSDYGWVDGKIALTADFGDGSALGSISGTIDQLEDWSTGEAIGGVINLHKTGDATTGADITNVDGGFFDGDTSGTLMFEDSEGDDVSIGVAGKWGGEFTDHRDGETNPAAVFGTAGATDTDASDDYTLNFVGMYYGVKE